MVTTDIEMKDIVLKQKFSLIFKDVNYEVIEEVGRKKIKKKIMDNMNGYCQSGELTAIMGPSGSGNNIFLIIYNYR